MPSTVPATDALREQLATFQDWREAHADFDSAVAGIPPDLRGVAPPGLPYSPWQLLEHMRLTQVDILEFCRDKDYIERLWPRDYWPASAAPPDATGWDASIAGFQRDRAELQAMIRDPKRDLLGKVPAGTQQTFLREYLLVADHTAYHVGQLIAVRRLLGAWTSP